MIKGYAPKTKSVHQVIKKGYTAGHIKNSKSKKWKQLKMSHAVRLAQAAPPGLEMGINNDEEES